MCDHFSVFVSERIIFLHIRLTKYDRDVFVVLPDRTKFQVGTLGSQQV